MTPIVDTEWRPMEQLQPAQMQRLLEISTTLNSTLDLAALLELVMDVSMKLTDSEAASILLRNEVTGELRFVAAAGVEAPKDMVVPAEGSVAGWVVQQRQPLVLSDAQHDERHYAGVDDRTSYTTRSLLAVPLLYREKVIGALETLNKRGDAAYTPQDVTLLQVLAAQAAVAIQNARLFEQSDLWGDMMHELKTPLLALTLAGDLLGRGLSTEQQKEIGSVVQAEARRLVKMTQDFLDFTRLQSGRLKLELTRIQPDSLVRSVVKLQKPQADAAGISVKVDAVPGLPRILADENRLRQIILNLVSNAIKYNVPDGRIIIYVREEGAMLTIAVQDTGRGIAAADLPRLFERFYRVPDSEGYSEGTGLGLAITRRLVEEHDGEIEISSEVGVGTTFTVRLPINPVSG